MKIFGDFYDRAISFKPSKREQSVKTSEDWSAAVMTGSSDQVAGYDSLPIAFFIVFAVATLGVAIVLFARLANLQIVNGRQSTALAAGNRVRSQNITAPRGTIYDRNGQVVARNVANYDLTAMPSQLPSNATDRQSQYNLLAGLLRSSPAELKAKAESKGLKYSQAVVVAENVDRDTALNIDEYQAGLRGFSIEVNPIREYLDGGNLSHFLGYTGRISAEEWAQYPNYRQIDYIGKSGLEQSYEQDLKGVDGKEQTAVDASGQPIKYLAKIEPTPGNGLILSIDKNLQAKAYEALAAGVQKAGAKAGAAIAVNPQNGQVLAAVNYPGYDNNLFAKGISQADYSRLLNDPSKPLFNRTLNGSYPIGSTIKPFISSAALDEKVINASTIVDDKGKLEVQNQYNPSIVYTFKGWEASGLGPVNVVKALTWSSDIFFYVVGGGYQGFKGVGPEKLVAWYKKFGFGQKTNIDIKSESNGYVPTPATKQQKTGEPWGLGDTYNISIGQGDFLATPMQLVMATAAIANGGTLYEPRVALEVRSPSGQTVRKIEPVPVRQNVVSSQALDLIRQGMEQAVAAGTACCSIKNEVPVQVAGKTGTAETSSQGFDGKNPTTKPDAWFVAYAPAKNPQIAMVVLVENSGEGAEYSVPVTNEILKWYFSPR
ncbi:penicillin-binding protein 2 [Candidatus Saccharibacteria bacterium]|nr:penicillin-binding protein 2 [Candidatus Saccharibacteria bacterium]